MFLFCFNQPQDRPLEHWHMVRKRKKRDQIKSPEIVLCLNFIKIETRSRLRSNWWMRTTKSKLKVPKLIHHHGCKMASIYKQKITWWSKNRPKPGNNPKVYKLHCGGLDWAINGYLGGKPEGALGRRLNIVLTQFCSFHKEPWQSSSAPSNL